VRWTAVIPVKPLALAKSRLRGAVADAVHEDLVLAMAVDTVRAATASGRLVGVLVVTDDARVRDAVTAIGASCLPDRAAGGLNRALSYGAASLSGPVAALTADLPALRPQELAAALDRASDAACVDGRMFVADADGAGTVLLTAASGMALAPRFGPGSAAAHRASGAGELTGDWPTLRRDVDTPDDLATARALGFGAATDALLQSVGAATDALLQDVGAATDALLDGVGDRATVRGCRGPSPRSTR
jgi:2-phospho-L-lactate guanylyltransferase